jgi:hypothetical protein
MQRNLTILAVISTMSLLVLAGLHLLNTSTQLAQGQNVILDNSTSSSTVEEGKVFQPHSKPYNITYGEWTARWWLIQYQEKLILPMMTRVNTVQKISEGLFGSFLGLMANQ